MKIKELIDILTPLDPDGIVFVAGADVKFICGSPPDIVIDDMVFETDMNIYYREIDVEEKTP